MSLRFCLLCLAIPLSLNGADGNPAEYVGGTLIDVPARTDGRIRTTDPDSFIFLTKKAEVRIPYERINQIEYGQKVNRRYIEAILLSPAFMLAKKRDHFLTVAYQTEEGQQHALVLKIDKGSIRSVLVSLEAKTGRKVVYQDEEARKAGKG